MRLQKVAMAAIFCLAVTSMGFAADPNVGTWKLNESRSKIPDGVGKNTTVIYTAEGDEYTAKIEGVSAKGEQIRSEWKGKFDGQDYTVTGDPSVDARSIKMTSPGHYTIANKKGGKTVATGTLTVSKDGKTRTVTTHGTDANGKKYTATYIYDKQK
jgi:hypothetical protein